jgi:hypothetical protein
VKNESRDLGESLEIFQTLKLSCSEVIGCGEPANRIVRGIFPASSRGARSELRFRNYVMCLAAEGSGSSTAASLR